MTRKLFSRVRHLNIQSTAIRRGSMKMSALLVRSPKRSPKIQLSSRRRVDSQKSVELLVLYRLCVTPLRARRTAAREERLSCPVLANLRMVRSLFCFVILEINFSGFCSSQLLILQGTLSASSSKAIKTPKLYWRNPGILSNHLSNKWELVPWLASKIQSSIAMK